MGRVIVKLAENEYVDFSSIVDAPVTYIMDREKAHQYIRNASVDGNGDRIGSDPDDRIERLEKYGTTSRMDRSAEEAISGNRAGPQESQLTLDQMRRFYVSEESYEAQSDRGHIIDVPYVGDEEFTYAVWVDA